MLPVRSQRFSALFIAACCIAAAAQTIHITSPSAEDTLFTGDTITVNLEYDKAFEDAAPGVVVRLSVDYGDNFTILNPIQREGGGQIPLYEPWARTPMFVVPDSLILSDAPWVNGQPVKVSLISDKVILEVSAYNDGTLRDETPCCLTIAAPAVTVVSPVAGTTLYTNDTITVVYQANAGFKRKSAAVLVEVSPDSGAHWFGMAPMQSPAVESIPFYASWAGAPAFIIPDTLRSSKYRDHLLNEIPIALGSSEILLRVRSVDNPQLGVITGPFVVLAGEIKEQVPTDNGTGGSCGTGSAAILIPLLVTRAFGRRKKPGYALAKQC